MLQTWVGVSDGQIGQIIVRIRGQRNRLTIEHFLLMRLPRRFWRASFDRIPENARPTIRAYLRGLDDHLDNGSGLLLWGMNGCGKSSAAAFIAKETRRTGASVLFMTAESVREAALSDEQVEDGSLLDRAMTVDLLVIDDLGKETRDARGWSARLFENLIRERLAAQLSTIITTNDSPKALQKIYPDSMLEALKEGVVPVRVSGDNLRDAAQDALRESLAVG